MSISHYYNAGKEIVLDYIKNILREAKKTGKTCILCEELAGDTKFTEKLLHLGLKNFSVSVSRIPKFKDKINKIL
ncbi:MAG: putative PEP-binding protein [Elusimicrobiota bacterium]